jgi:dihydrofolate reductase
MEVRPQLISVIAAVAQNRVIGKDNAMPWHLPEDLQHFKELTMGHHIVMGRKTYQSIGRVLPGRTTVIVTRDAGFKVPECITALSINAALAAAYGDPEVFFVGGADLYAQILPRAQRLYITEIKKSFDGDAWFPLYDASEWQEVARASYISGEGLEYDYVTYDRLAS